MVLCRVYSSYRDRYERGRREVYSVCKGVAWGKNGANSGITQHFAAARSTSQEGHNDFLKAPVELKEMLNCVDCRSTAVASPACDWTKEGLSKIGSWKR
jgi:hypothetical protein